MYTVNSSIPPRGDLPEDVQLRILQAQLDQLADLIRDSCPHLARIDVRPDTVQIMYDGGGVWRVALWDKQLTLGLIRDIVDQMRR